MLRVAIDERMRRKYNLRGETIGFEELRLRIIGQEGKAFLREAQRIAAKTGLGKMTRKEIRAEIKAARNGTDRF
jgi:hypothetical protein